MESLEVRRALTIPSISNRDIGRCWVGGVDILGLLARSGGLLVMGEAWLLSLVVLEGVHSRDLSFFKSYFIYLIIPN